MLVSLQINLTATAAMPAQVVWTLFSFTLWAVAANWIYNVLAYSGAKTKVDEETGETITVEALDRRQFMVRIGGASAVLTVIGAGLGAFIGSRPGAGQVAGEASGASDGDVLPNLEGNMEPAPGHATGIYTA